MESKCPYCGSSDGVYYNTKMLYETQVTWDGDINESVYLNTIGPVPKTARCMSCKKRVPNPDFRIIKK